MSLISFVCKKLIVSLEKNILRKRLVLSNLSLILGSLPDVTVSVQRGNGSCGKLNITVNVIIN